MSGLGAWSFGYYQYGMAVPNDRVSAGIIAFKHALADNGYGKNIDLTLGKFGTAMRKRTREFQAAQGITADGVIGPTTARHLFRHYSYQEEGTSTIEMPDHLLQRLGGAESGHDPVAQGYADPEDEGWAQINGPSHPNITLQQRWSPSFAIVWAGQYLKTFYVNEVGDWDGAIASYNVGYFYAKKWVGAGKPASGLWANGTDMYQRAYHYVQLVKAQAV